MSKTEQTNRKWIDQFMIKIQDRSFILKIIGLSLVIIFWNLLFSIYSTLIIEPILSKYKANWTIDLTVLSCCLLIAIIFIYKVGKKEYKILSSNLLFLLSAICILYSIVRFSNSGFEYYPLYFSKDIAIADFIIMIISGIAIYSFFQIILSQKRLPSNNEESEVDSLSLDNYSKAVADLIKIKKGCKDSFAIGIVGKWGDGKTFFMNLVKRDLIIDNDCIVIDFNPWYSNNPKTLISDFFATLKNELKKHNPNISSSFNSYARQLVKYYDKNNAIESVFDSITNSSPALKEQFIQVKKAIEKIDRQIVICIDDLDRLDKEEIIEVIRLIRNTANFNNTIFLVTYDKDYVNSAIKSLNEHGCDTYLEKIFQQEVILPAINSFVLKKKLKEELSSRIGIEWVSLIDSKIFNESYPLINFDDFFDNYRDIYRFTNLFTLPFLQLKDNVYEMDFFYLQLLNFKYPYIYQLIKIDLFKNNPGFFSFNYLDNTNKVTFKYVYEQLLPANGGTGISTIAINKHLSTYSLSENDISIIMKLLNYLFPFIPENFISDPTFYKTRVVKNDYRRICHVVNYKKYFTFRNLELNIPNSELKELFAKTQVEINQQIALWVMEGKYETLEVYFKNIKSPISKNAYEIFIKSLFHFLNQKSPNDKNRPIGFQNKFIRKWISLKYVMHLYPDPTEHKSFILETFSNTETTPLFSSRFITQQLTNWSEDSEGNYKMPFLIEEAFNLNYQYLQNHINKSNFFTDNTFWLYNDCNHSNNPFLIKANSLMISFAKDKDLKNFLQLIIGVFPNAKTHQLSTHVKSIFENYEKFEEFLNTVNNEEIYFQEFMNFYNEAKKNNYESTNFNFKHLNINNQDYIEDKIVLNYN